MRLVTAFVIVFSTFLEAQVKPVVSQRQMSDEVTVVRLAPRFATAIRLQEPVSSVVVGDPARFLAEHSEKEPTLVLVKPVVDEPAESNLLVNTASGRQISFVLKSEALSGKAVDFVLNYQPSRTFLIEESEITSLEVPGTESLPQTAGTTANTRTIGLQNPVGATGHGRSENSLEALLDRQRRAELPELYGRRPPSPEKQSDYVMAGVSEVIDQGREVLVLFSVVNPQNHPIEILAPQIQLAGKIKRNRWGSSEQFPIKDFRLSRRRLGTGERADGVVLFNRPAFKQSNETLFLQIAESGAVDRPALAPIGFGVSAVRKEANDEGREK